VEGQPWQYVLGTIVTVFLGYLTYRGAKITADRAREGNNRTADVNEQQSALDAWKSLTQPTLQEVDRLRTELKTERDERIAKERRDEKDRAAAKKLVQEQMDALNRRIDSLTQQLTEWKRLAQTIARWASRLRDEVLRLGGTVPATPEELLVLQAIEDSETP
jgi:predicted RNase H-like nuclease (RuvC/YqgF family)